MADQRTREASSDLWLRQLLRHETTATITTSKGHCRSLRHGKPQMGVENWAQGGRLKKQYHHGELKQALIAAARQLIGERGGSDFSLSDACRRAGVSTAAPYRHFADKSEIVREVLAEGYIDMTNQFLAATAALPEGSVERMIALGQVYINFAVTEPALFRMMFSRLPDSSEDNIVNKRGKACFDTMLQEVTAYCRNCGMENDSLMVALQLWTFTHGLSCLTIAGEYALVAPDLNVADLMMAAGTKFLTPPGHR